MQWCKSSWNKEDYEIFQKELIKLAEESFQQFQKKLIPHTNSILGIRIPKCKQIAKEIAKGDWKSFLKQAQDTTHEEILIQGFVIGFMKEEPEIILALTKEFLPKINNWAICDCFCAGLKIVKKEQPLFWNFIQECLKTEEEFILRFAIVLGMSYYIDEKYLDSLFSSYNQIKHEGYYVKMAVAWAISACFIKYREKTEQFLNHNTLDDFTYNKALQKIIESNRVDKEEKEQMKKRKRK